MDTAAAAGGVLAWRREALERLYRHYNRRSQVQPDPLEVLYRHDDPGDRELAGLIASSLAFGRVRHILASVNLVLAQMGPRPRRWLLSASPAALRRTFRGFCHRFARCRELGGLLTAAGGAITEFGSLGACFQAGLGPDDQTVLPALTAFVRRLREAGAGRDNFLLPDPDRGSACKRLNLFLRWMVRRDEVDVGAWPGEARPKLLVPLDTHMHRICRAMGLTARKQADLRTVLEVTASFRAIAPDDPVRYDFALTRLGMRAQTDLAEFVRTYTAAGPR